MAKMLTFEDMYGDLFKCVLSSSGAPHVFLHGKYTVESGVKVFGIQEKKKYRGKNRMEEWEREGERLLQDGFF